MMRVTFYDGYGSEVETFTIEQLVSEERRRSVLLRTAQRVAAFMHAQAGDGLDGRVEWHIQEKERSR